MHPVADKIVLSSFDGRLDILGSGRDVAFVTEDGDPGGGAQTVLVIKGLTLAEAWDALSRLHGPVVVSEAKPDKKPKEAKKEPEQMDLPKTEAKKEEPKKEPAKAETKKPPPPANDLDELDIDPKAQDWNGLDIEFLKKQDKLRPVIEHMREHGFDTVEKVVEISRTLKATVPALQAVDQKGGFDQRMERNAMVVLAPAETAAS